MDVSPPRGRSWRWFDVIVVQTSRILSLVPLALLVLLVSHALHVRLFLGRWPVVYRDEPDSFLLNVHQRAIIAAAFATYFGMPVWAAAVVGRVARRQAPARELATQIGCIAAGLGGLALLAAVDPTGYFEWFID
jgi:hypothetical protein